MSSFLIAALGAAVALFLTLIDPSMRNVRAIKVGAVAALAASAAAMLWPSYAVALFVAAFTLAMLWLFAQALFWPFRLLGRLLRGE